MGLNCAFCASQKLTQVLDLGEVALAGAFLRPHQFEAEKRYPLKLLFCEACAAVQVADPVEPDTLFANYFYHSSASATVRAHARNTAHRLVERMGHSGRWIEVGANDGVLMRELRALGVQAIGFDPSSVAKDVPGVVNDYFTADKLGDEKADVIVANNVFAHIPNICRVTQDIVRSVKPGGSFVFEVHDLYRMVSDLQYDWIYHEHLYYYSTTALVNHFGRFGWVIYDIEPVALHGGSMRYYACRAGARPIADLVSRRLDAERQLGLHKPEPLMRFGSFVEGHRREVVNLFDSLVDMGVSVAGYGASGRAATLLQHWGAQLAYVVDDSPAKQGYCMPGTHIPIHPSERLDSNPTDYVMVLAWTYMGEIAPKCRGIPMIVPLPTLRYEAERMVA